MKLVIWTDGDSSVGIAGERIEMEWDLESYDETFQAFAIEQLKEIFSDMLDGGVKIMDADKERML